MQTKCTTTFVFASFTCIDYFGYNHAAISDKLETISNYLSLKKSGFTGVMDWALDLRDTFKIPTTPASLGAQIEQIDELARMAAEDPTASGNPMPVGPSEMREIYERAFRGLI